MKKNVFLFVALLGIVALMSNCKKDIESTSFSADAWPDKAKIELTVYKVIDVTVDASSSDTVALADQAVTAIIANSQFVSLTPGNWTQTLMTDASGKVTFEVPAKEESTVSVTFRSKAFTGQQDGKEGTFSEATTGATVRSKDVRYETIYHVTHVDIP